MLVLFPPIMNFAEHVRMHRFRSGLTQEILAARVGVSRQTISMIEAGKTVPGVYRAIAIARELDIDFDSVRLPNDR